MLTNDPSVPSLLDRLIGPEPAPRGRFNADPTRFTREAIVRDLQRLLNTRARCVGWPDELKELDTTLLNYGLGDFADRDFATEGDREDLCDAIRKAIDLFEPRLRDVQVEVLPSEDPADRYVRMQITAALARHDDELFAFDLDLTTAEGEFKARAL